MNEISGSKTLHRLMYRSHFTIPRADLDEAITSIISTSIRNNRQVAITGLLLVYEDDCIQALEGPAEAVLTTYGRICNDPRHETPIVISAGPVTAREFGDWNMCARRLTPADDAILKTLGAHGTLDPARLDGRKALRLLKSIRGIQERTQLQAMR